MAKVCRRVCGLTRRSTPAARAARFTRVRTLREVSRPPRALTKRGPRASGRPPRYASRARAAPATEGNDPLLAALAEDADGHRLAIHVVDVEPGQLGDAQPARVEQLEDGHVARAGAAAESARVHHRHGLVDGEEGDELPGQTRAPDVARRVALHHAPPHEEAKPAAQGGQVAGHRDGIEAAAVEMGEVGADQPAVDLLHLRAAAPRRRSGGSPRGRCDRRAGYAATRAAPPRDSGGTAAQLGHAPGRLDLALEVAPRAHAPPHDATARRPLGQERRPALRTGLRHGVLPDRERAGGIGGAAVEDAAAPATPGHELARASRLGARDPQGDRLGGLALGITRARDEPAVAAVLDDHRLAAGRARLVGGLVGGALVPAQIAGVAAVGIGRARQELAEAAPALEQGLAAIGAGLPRLRPDLDVAHLLLGAAQFGLEASVELLHRVGPGAVAVLDLVERVLHLRGELDVHDLREEGLQEVGHLDAELGGKEGAALAPHVAALVDDGPEDRRVGGRAADPQLLQDFHQRGLGVTRRRLREVLLGIEPEQGEHLADFERGNRTLRLVLGGRLALLAALHVHGGEALELEGLALGPEQRDRSGLAPRSGRRPAPPRCRRPRCHRRPAASGWPRSAPRSADRGRADPW